MSSPKHILSFNLAMKFCSSSPTQLELPKILVHLCVALSNSYIYLYIFLHKHPEASVYAYLEDGDNHCHGLLNVCRRWATPTDTRDSAVFHIWLIALRCTFHLHYIIDNKYVRASLMQDCWRLLPYIFFSCPAMWFFVATTLWQAGSHRMWRHISRRKEKKEKEKWVLNGPLASPSLVIQICHAVHTLYNGTFLCFFSGSEHCSVYDNVFLSSPVLLLPEARDNERL